MSQSTMRSLWRVSLKWLRMTKLLAHFYPTNILRIKRLTELIWWTSSIPCTLITWNKLSTTLVNRDMVKNRRMTRNTRFWPQTDGWASCLNCHFIRVSKFTNSNNHELCYREKWKDCPPVEVKLKAQKSKCEEKEVWSQGIIGTIQGAGSY